MTTMTASAKGRPSSERSRLQRTQRDDCHLFSSEQQVVLLKFHTGHIKVNSFMHRKLKLGQVARVVKKTKSQSMFYKDAPSYKRRCVACQHSLEDQTLHLQTRLGEYSFINLPSSPYHVACEHQKGQSYTPACMQTTPPSSLTPSLLSY